MRAFIVVGTRTERLRLRVTAPSADAARDAVWGTDLEAPGVAHERGVEILERRYSAGTLSNIAIEVVRPEDDT